ncbi:MAG: hypothetical protein MnENMB40S_18250 [Rhizobiaceae bacterium MnEN-MB40S]|nr:MAG: hypothetical protein MnENMB40S_18250 [Rhizobiaceae bacterium MnEN-MB40S]
MKKKYEKPLTTEEIAALPDSEIDTSDIPELDDNFWKNAKISPPRTKPNVSLRLPEDVVNFFKKENPKGYTSRMAAVLSAYVQAHQTKS